MACKHDVPRIDAEPRRVARTREVESGPRVLHRIADREIAWRAPGAAISEGEDVPTGAADGLGEIEMAFVARKPVRQDHGRARRLACGCERDRIHAVGGGGT